MSGLYNVLFGVNPCAGMLLHLLKVDFEKIPRFRDCFVNEKDEIVIFTRTGASNRQDYEEGIDLLKAIPGFLYDKDDETDCTYAHFCYKFPEHLPGYLAILKSKGYTVDMTKRWKEQFDALEKTSRRNTTPKE